VKLGPSLIFPSFKLIELLSVLVKTWESLIHVLGSSEKVANLSRSIKRTARENPENRTRPGSFPTQSPSEKKALFLWI